MVSFYLSPERDTIGHEATVQRLHALVRQAKRLLGAPPWRFTEAEADRLIEPVGVGMAEVERGPDESLVWFVSSTGTEQYLVGGFVADRVTVADTVDLLPVASALDDDVSFHLLVLSQNHVHLYHCDGIGWRRLPGEQMPESRADALWSEGRDQVNDVTVEAIKDDRKQATARFVQAVARHLPTAVHDASVPLVVAAVEYEAVMFRDASHHPDIELLTPCGSPEHVPIAKMHAQAVDLLRGRRREQRAFLLERYRALVGTGKTVRGNDDTQSAADRGQVEVVLIPRFVGLIAEPMRQPLVTVVAAVLSHGGTVATIDEAEDEVLPVAAILRY